MNTEVYMRENYKDDYEKGMLGYLEKQKKNTYKFKDDAVMYKNR